MPPLNPHILPLMPYPGLAPELDIRSGMGGWDAYALDAPNDRLLPFVLSRRMVPSNSAWVNCIWVEHADTGERIQTLLPTGATVVPVPSLGVVFTKLTDAPNKAEHFTYNGNPIAGLDLPCGVPLRLIVDNTYQSARFVALAPAGEMAQTHLTLEWYHDGPLDGVPYGRGFRQRFYLRNGSLQTLEAREIKESTPDPDGGAERIDALSLFAQTAFTVEPTPAYLAQAIMAARAPKYLLADGNPWRLLTVKATTAGNDGGRTTLIGTLEDETPLLRRGCLTPALPVEAYDPDASAPRGWRCGDESDTQPDYVNTGVYSCEVDGNGRNTGYVLETTQDLNPNSPSYGQIAYRTSASPDLARCPVPTVYYNTKQTAYARRNDCGPGFFGSVEPFVVPAGEYSSTTKQSDADDQALAAAQAQAQANANATGVCAAGRSVRLANVIPKNKLVQLDIERSDTAGELLATVFVQAQIDDGSAVMARQFTRTFTVPDGSDALREVSVPFSGGVLVELEIIEIQATQPSDYTH